MRLKVKIDFFKEVHPEKRIELEQRLIMAINETEGLPKYNISFSWKKGRNVLQSNNEGKENKMSAV